jgi:hypothetical protein
VDELGNHTSGTSFKNNICLGKFNKESDGESWEANNNIYCTDDEAPLYFAYVPHSYTLAEAQAMGVEANSISLINTEINNILNNVSGSDLSLKNGSVAIGVGETLDAAYDDGLDASTDWGSDTEVPVVVTKQQGAAWDIGAYVH